MNYTAIGGSVNLAARLESLNKHYGTQILVSNAVVEAAEPNFLFRPVDRVMPKGATHPLDIHELVGTIGAVEGAEHLLPVTGFERDYCADWRSAYQAYRSRNWSEASTAFEALRAKNDGDALAARYAERASAFISQPPPPDWDGVEVFDTK